VHAIISELHSPQLSILIAYLLSWPKRKAAWTHQSPWVLTTGPSPQASVCWSDSLLYLYRSLQWMTMSCLVTTEPQWSIHDQDAATLKIWRKFQKKGKQSILHVDNYGRRPKDFAPLIYEDTRGKVAPSTKLWVLTFGYDNSMLKMAFLLIILYNSPTFGDDSRDTFGPQHTRFNLLKAHK
jgi:hypothetical protein